MQSNTFAFKPSQLIFELFDLLVLSAVSAFSLVTSPLPTSSIIRFRLLVCTSSPFSATAAVQSLDDINRPPDLLSFKPTL